MGRSVDEMVSKAASEFMAMITEELPPKCKRNVIEAKLRQLMNQVARTAGEDPSYKAELEQQADAEVARRVSARTAELQAAKELLELSLRNEKAAAAGAYELKYAFECVVGFVRRAWENS